MYLCESVTWNLVMASQWGKGIEHVPQSGDTALLRLWMSMMG